MRRALLITVSLLVCSNAWAAVYRWIDEDGHVQFSDRWIQGSERLNVPKAADRSDSTAAPSPEPSSPDEVFLGPYTALEIVSPAANESLTQAEAGISVSLMVDPPIIDGQQLSVLLDDVPLPVKDAATQFRLTGAALGSHRLQLRVKGVDGRVVAQSAPLNFHIRKPKEPGQLR